VPKLTWTDGVRRDEVQNGSVMELREFSRSVVRCDRVKLGRLLGLLDRTKLAEIGDIMAICQVS
jgi:hypothetical protein